MSSSIDAANKLCEVPENKVCDVVTTQCQQQNGSTHCACKNGFQKDYDDATFCKGMGLILINML